MCCKSFLKGMTTGLIVGSTAVFIINPLDNKDKKRISKKTSQMFTTIGSFADHIIDLYK